MRPGSAAVLALVLGLSACTADDEPGQAGPPSASPSAATTSDGDEPVEDPSEDGATDGEHGTDDPDGPPDTTGTDGTDGDATDGDVDEDTAADTPDTTDDDGSDEPDPSSRTRGGPASDTPATPVRYGPEGSGFEPTAEHHRAADYSSRCYVEPAEGESFDECVRLYSYPNEAWMTLVEATDPAGAVTVTLYRSAGGDFTSAFRAVATDTTTYALRETGWANTQDHFVATGPDGHDVLAWDVPGDPRLVAHLPADGTTTFTARRIVRRTSSTIEVLAVAEPGDALEGSSTPTGSEEDVALRVYAAWVHGDRAAAEPRATDKVLDELFEDTPASNDSFALDGTDCGQAGTQVACGFTATSDGRTATMTWTLGTVDGELQVVRIDSEG